MARLSASLLAVFLCLAVSSSALPANAAGAAQPSPSNANEEASAKLAYDVLKVCSQLM